jgi:hypothetical protein
MKLKGGFISILIKKGMINTNYDVGQMLVANNLRRIFNFLNTDQLIYSFSILVSIFVKRKGHTWLKNNH